MGKRPETINQRYHIFLVVSIIFAKLASCLLTQITVANMEYHLPESSGSGVELGFPFYTTCQHL